MQTEIMKALDDVFKQFDDRYYVNDILNKAKVIEDVDTYREDLIQVMMANDLVKKHFSVALGDYTIIETNKLIETLEMNDYWKDSYTKYSKKIGLTVNGRFLDEQEAVVLDFPYKDTVLKAGMTKEDVGKDDLKPDELFYNEVIAREEIDVMLDNKILVNAKHYDKDGVQDATEFTDKDNLILKGNNLLALHTLKERYQGKVKLIYIDPPYNTGKDSFHYNDNFNHSTWLTFIKNRLEIAWELLSEEGTIWISIDDYESHYLKVLADSIFGRENFLNEVIWQRAYAPINLKKTFSRSHDAILVYAKNNSSQKVLNGVPRDDDANDRYTNPDNDPRGPWQSDNFSVGPAVERNIYEIITPTGRTVLPPNGRSWLFSKKRFEELRKDNRVWFGSDGKNVPRVKRFLSEVKNDVVAQTLWTYQEVGHNQDAKREIKELFEGQAAFGTPKPERLIQRIVQIGSNENDLVLDFFMGSATTQAVAMKMNRQFIGIEQMDYTNTVSVPRLQKVIEGEQGGISKDVNWQGGCSFIYAELMEKSRGYLTMIQEAVDQADLMRIYQFMLDNVSLDFRADLLAIEEMLEGDIKLDEKKKLLMKVIDKNQLYYNYSEIDDEEVRELITDSDYAFNQSFYKEGELNG
ncbi:type III restriction endonuclease subunit M [Dolosicoccus paucivorans]|uniref:Type III restriction endonuclease subunit M n=1 Tax=Dolosicoccus paucivorans TaxID=84521 RepID=A0A2N6SL28_9LACT|nr:site-specific DNA-methyltransferase [Dolosicoccus paucivorans]PMB83635.1 type III restriction endonuclease subunit M [Dolosicoccus paucivorans]PMC57775.1 type III restriction endonuclease subunit M [Dolosicoccus paucivorans]